MSGRTVTAVVVPSRKSNAELMGLVEASGEFEQYVG